MTADRLDTGRDKRGRLLLVLGVLLVVGFLVLSYVLSHYVFGYVECGGIGPPARAFDVVETSPGHCWTYKMPWP